MYKVEIKTIDSKSQRMIFVKQKPSKEAFVLWGLDWAADNFIDYEIDEELRGIKTIGKYKRGYRIVIEVGHEYAGEYQYGTGSIYIKCTKIKGTKAVVLDNLLIEKFLTHKHPVIRALAKGHIKQDEQ